MTYTTQVEWHEERTLVHFGSPPGTDYYREATEQEEDMAKNSTNSKKPKGAGRAKSNGKKHSRKK